VLSRFYARVARGVLQNRPRFVLFACASTMHAVGHAAMALAAGACARAMVANGTLLRPADPRSASPAILDHALSLGLIGLGAVLIKVLAGVYASYAQARMVGTVGAELRLDVLEGWLAQHRLHRPRQMDHADEATTPRSAQTDSSNVSNSRSMRESNGVAPSANKDDFDKAGPHAQGVAALTSRVQDVENGLQTGVLGGARAIAQLLPLLAALI
jgi:hypothetical protein